ncbi:nucleotidyl transferase AbiEii/AbiGii toxin family protein [Cupriavidus gilardii]|nr:nucleotidyl transferase AbiEii/AbiGii toxin family protein [Cupriavidus gilardii]
MIERDDLPQGAWQTLFPRALKLVDEIEKHRGRRPFFTFGGGTVLMLRHGHRLSKDIDIFVPDPQSLGYVTPRLSDVADELCNSQYVEASEFVKLQMPEGEIDFVASPNLLSPSDAFEEWKLFGQPVRVETAAEIVAKKMYFRGDRATARDLFDFALVAEREPDALAKCDNFMMRNLESFRARVRTPDPQFLRQFDAIETLNYQPTFDEASSRALHYLDALSASLTKSQDAAHAFASAAGATVQPVDVDRGEYCGPIVHRTERHIVQAVGRGDVVIHEAFRLPAQIREHDAGATPVRLRYHRNEAQILSRGREGGHER